MTTTLKIDAAASGTFSLGDMTIHRLGFGAMRITGPGIWGEPKNPDAAKAVLRRAVECGVNFIDTADSYGPEVSERLIAETLYPYPVGPAHRHQGRTDAAGSRSMGARRPAGILCGNEWK